MVGNVFVVQHAASDTEIKDLSTETQPVRDVKALYTSSERVV